MNTKNIAARRLETMNKQQFGLEHTMAYSPWTVSNQSVTDSVGNVDNNLTTVLEQQQPLQYKYNEDINMSRIQEYINSTYGQHYVGNGDIQTVDFWESLGTLESTSRDTAIKYLARYGKKEGRNRKDLLKAVHYILLMMYAADKENAE
jgi:Protein of unknwon function (DUF3310)